MKSRLTKILKTTNNVFTFSGTYTDLEGNTHNYTLFSNDTFRQLVKQLFGMRLYNDWDDETDLAGLCTDFVSSFNTWKNSRSDMYMARLFALDQKFNPLENYRSHETRSGSFTHGESVELSFTNRKDVQKDDSYVDHTYNNYKETTKDDTFTERTYTDFKEAQTDDSYVERTYTNFKETQTDDSYVERSYNNYEETNGHGQQTHTRNTSADDDALGFVPAEQNIDAQYDDTKEIDGSYKDQNGYTNGLEKETSGSYKDQQGYTKGLEKTTTGSYKDQNGFVTYGNEKAVTGSYKEQKGQIQDGLTNEKQGKETTAHSGTDLDGYTLDRYGNIGVTTSQQMLASDLDLLKYDIVMEAIREFIGRFTYFSEEVDI